MAYSFHSALYRAQGEARKLRLEKRHMVVESSKMRMDIEDLKEQMAAMTERLQSTEAQLADVLPRLIQAEAQVADVLPGVELTRQEGMNEVWEEIGVLERRLGSTEEEVADAKEAADKAIIDSGYAEGRADEAMRRVMGVHLVVVEGGPDAGQPGVLARLESLEDTIEDFNEGPLAHDAADMAINARNDAYAAMQKAQEVEAMIVGGGGGLQQPGLRARVTGLETTSVFLREDNERLHGKCDALENNIDSTEGNVAMAGKRMDTLRGRITGLEACQQDSSILALDTRFNAAHQRITELHEKLLGVMQASDQTNMSTDAGKQQDGNITTGEEALQQQQSQGSPEVAPEAATSGCE